MMNFLKGIMIGLGAIAPGLSGSVLLVLFGLYEKTIAAISSLLKHFRKNMRFLLPLGAGILLGVLLFSKLVDWLLAVCEMQTRFAFFGFILGSIPLFYKEVRKNGFHWKFWLCTAGAFALGLFLFNFNRHLFPPVTEPNLLQSILLGLVVAASYIVPGVDSAAILSALGLYDLWVHSLATLDFGILIPAAVGLAVGVLSVSALIHFLMRRCYTLTFSLIFGLFLSIVPSVLNESCVPGWNVPTLISMIVMAVSFTASLLFSHLDQLKEKLQTKKEPE